MQSKRDTYRTSAYVNDFFFFEELKKKNLRNIYVRLHVIEIGFQMWKKPRGTRKHVISRRQVGYHDWTTTILLEYFLVLLFFFFIYIFRNRIRVCYVTTENR